jgi:hypothetical protein
MTTEFLSRAAQQVCYLAGSISRAAVGGEIYGIRKMWATVQKRNSFFSASARFRHAEENGTHTMAGSATTAPVAIPFLKHFHKAAVLIR